MEKRCKVREAAIVALAIASTIEELKRQRLAANPVEQVAIDAEIDLAERKQTQLHDQAARFYANSEFGAGFQIGLAKAALNGVLASDLPPYQKERLRPIAHVLESLGRYLSSSAPNIPESGRARARRR